MPLSLRHVLDRLSILRSIFLRLPAIESFEDVLIVDINCLIFILVYSGAILKIFNCIVYVMMHCFKKKDNFQEERDNGGAKQSGEEIK